MLRRRLLAPALLAALLVTEVTPAAGQLRSPEQSLRGLDTYITQVMHDWSVPGLGVAVVMGDSVVFAQGYGYRDYGRSLPFTTQTLFPIASNTKLFTAVAAGLLVQEGKLDWDVPLRHYVPSLQFHNEELNRTVTMRDLLAHRTGVRRHDNVWFRSDFTREELFERIRYLEPSVPLRSRFLYNNLMYVGAGRSIELLSGTTWEEFVLTRILEPLGMNSTIFSIAGMRDQPDHATPYSMRRDTTALYQVPFLEDDAGVGPAGAMISNLEDMSRWLVALINGGSFQGRQAIPVSIIDETLAPTLALPRRPVRARGWRELVNPVYGMGRWTATYRGHLIAYHGGDLPGFHSQVSVMPYDSIGVVVLVIGDHATPLYNAITFNVYERLLGMTPIPWSERFNAVRLRNREAAAAARRLAAERAVDANPKRPLADYAGDFVHPAYGALSIGIADTVLTFNFRGVTLPLYYDDANRFETPDDEFGGWWSVTFAAGPGGAIDRAEMPLDQRTVIFRRAPSAKSHLQEAQTMGTHEPPF